jgi:hypothetical protein
MATWKTKKEMEVVFASVTSPTTFIINGLKSVSVNLFKLLRFSWSVTRIFLYYRVLHPVARNIKL